MAYSANTKRRALEEVARRRRAATDAAESLKNACYAQFPRLLELDNLISEKGMQLTLLSVQNRALADAKRVEMEHLIKNREGFLKENNIPGDLFTVRFSCPRCSDTGYRGTELCSCVDSLIHEQEQAEICRVSPLALSRFADFSLSFYSQEVDPQFGLSPRKNMQNVLSCCKQYAKSYPTAQNLLMMGDAGLGKTHLALAIAGEILEKGAAAQYCSAANIFRTMEKEYFDWGRETTTLDLLKRCDFLVLDDLGAEYVNAFVVATVYDLINTRIVTGKPTVYTTNITRIEQFETRYGEKVSSRLTGCCRLLSFFGEDIRQIKK